MRTSLSALALGLLAFALSSTLVHAAGQPVVLQTKIVNDAQGTGGEAFRLLVPKGWVFDGGVTWDTQKFPAEAYTSFTVTSPDGNAMFEQFPHVSLFWSEDPMLQQSYAARGLEIMPPVTAEQALRELYVPNYRPQATQVEILEVQPLPELARQSTEWSQILMNIFGSISPFTFQFELRADSARAKIRYLADGKPMLEDVTLTVSYFIAYMPGVYGTVPAITWSAAPTTFRAPTAEMDRYLETFRAIAGSRRDNFAWHEHTTKLAAVITREQLRNQRAIFDRLQQIHRTQSETSDMLFESWQRRSQAYDRIFDNYSRSLRGIESYADPVNQRPVELPSGYRNAWTNGSDYILSDEAGFNPNIGSTQTWTEMHPER